MPSKKRGIICGLVISGWILLGAIIITVNCLPLYWVLVRHYHWGQSLGLNDQAAFREYLRVWQFLNVPTRTIIGGHLALSASAQAHFREVKYLVWGVYVGFIGITTLIKPVWQWSCDAYSQWLAQLVLRGVAGISICLASLAIVDFNDFFVIFHQLSFRNQDWLFDPRRDQIINLLPSYYFAICFGLFFVLFIGGILLGIWVLFTQLQRE